MLVGLRQMFLDVNSTRAQGHYLPDKIQDSIRRCEQAEPARLDVRDEIPIRIRAVLPGWSVTCHQSL
jgi:hypothetical protein